MRIGINTGPVVVGAIGRDLRMDYTALGDTVNLAARLLNVAQPGQIVASRHAKEMCEGFFVFEGLGEFHVKGKTEPLRAFALNGEIRGRTRLEVSRQRGLTPLVGRWAEKQRLAEAFGNANERRGGVVVIDGDAGVGKSRLVYEFLKSLDVTEHLELETTCVSFGRAMAYRPTLGSLQAVPRSAEGMSGAEIRERAPIDRRRPSTSTGTSRRCSSSIFSGSPVPQEFLLRVQGAQLKERTNRLLRSMLLREGEARRRWCSSSRTCTGSTRARRSS